MTTIEIGKHTIHFDDADQVTLSQRDWNVSWKGRDYYVCERRTNLLMHRIILGLEPGDPRLVDHRNGDTLDNRRSNLRLADRRQNALNARLSRNNTSGHKGVSWDTARNKWIAMVSIDGKKTSLGRFDDLNDAVKARLRAEREHYGEFARGHDRGDGAD